MREKGRVIEVGEGYGSGVLFVCMVVVVVLESILVLVSMWEIYKWSVVWE